MSEPRLLVEDARPKLVAAGRAFGLVRATRRLLRAPRRLLVRRLVGTARLDLGGLNLLRAAARFRAHRRFAAIRGRCRFT